MKNAPQKITTVLFWMKSNRGTDVKVVRQFEGRLSDEEIKSALTDWASTLPAWSHGDNIVTYGFRRIKIPPRDELLKRWEKVCKSRNKINEEWDTVRQMLNPQKMY
jgi:hypothetical protein